MGEPRKTPHRLHGTTPPRTTQPKVDVSYLSGKHSMKFGFSYNRYTKNQQLFGNPGGEFFFNNITGGTYRNDKYSGDPFMDMLLGFSSKLSRRPRPCPFATTSIETTSAYAMDNWKVTPAPKPTAGTSLRRSAAAWERGNNVSNFDPNCISPGQAPTYIPGSSSPVR